MPQSHPNVDTLGGDVPGFTKTDVVMGSPIEVAKCSYEPNYDIGTTLAAGDVSKADLMRGFCDHGKAIGE